VALDTIFGWEKEQPEINKTNIKKYIILFISNPFYKYFHYNTKK
jgi:hypothetical protein